MQLKLSIITFSLLSTLNILQAEDSIKIQYLHYNEDNGKTTISAPSLSITKDFGTDYTLNASIMTDYVSGASATYYKKDTNTTAAPTISSGASILVPEEDTGLASPTVLSGASAFSRGSTSVDNIVYGNVPYEEQRLATNLSLTTRLDNRDELSIGLNYSQEHDFYSYELSSEYMHWLDSSKNQFISVGASVQRNRILIQCDEYGSCDGYTGASKEDFNNVVNLQTSFFQNIDSSSYAKVSLFYSNENGYLSNPYMNVVRYNDGLSAFISNEDRPSLKIGYGTNIKYSKSFNNDLTMHINYRYYQDDWELSSHTIDTNVFYQATEDLLLTTGYRFYSQSDVFFHNASSNYFTNEEFATSDMRLSEFTANTYKIGFKYNILNDVSFDMSINYYEQSNGLISNYLISGMEYKY